jgi:hypothetical protein
MWDTDTTCTVMVNGNYEDIGRKINRIDTV